MKPKLVLSAMSIMKSCCILVLLCIFFSCFENGSAQDPQDEAAAGDPAVGEDESGEISDEDFIKRFDELSKTIACESMSNNTEEGGLKLKLDRPMSLEEVTRLTFLHKARNFSANALTFPDDIMWKRRLVNKIYQIFTDACPDEYIPTSYIILLRELMMIYMNSVEPRTTNNTEVWEALMESLDACSTSSHRMRYEFTSSGLEVTGVVTRSNADMNGRTGDFDQNKNEDSSSEEKQGNNVGDNEPPGVYSFHKQRETADIFQLDLIIETFWKVFSHSWATCLPEQESRELWGPRYKQLFFREILAPFEDRWKNSGTLLWELGIIAGDYDVELIHRNIPYCLEAPYLMNDLDQLQLIRPIKISEIAAGVKKFQNRRTS